MLFWISIPPFCVQSHLNAYWTRSADWTSCYRGFCTTVMSVLYPLRMYIETSILTLCKIKFCIRVWKCVWKLSCICWANYWLILTLLFWGKLPRTSPPSSLVNFSKKTKILSGFWYFLGNFFPFSRGFGFCLPCWPPFDYPKAPWTHPCPETAH